MNKESMMRFNRAIQEAIILIEVHDDVAALELADIKFAINQKFYQRYISDDRCREIEGVGIAD